MFVNIDTYMRVFVAFGLLCVCVVRACVCVHAGWAGGCGVLWCVVVWCVYLNFVLILMKHFL